MKLYLPVTRMDFCMLKAYTPSLPFLFVSERRRRKVFPSALK